MESLAGAENSSPQTSPDLSWHRDLKASDVLVDAATDQSRVTDFGLSKRLDVESSLKISGQVLGSGLSMSLDHFNGQTYHVQVTGDLLN